MFIKYAHRGASEYAPENTQEAFDLAFSLEFDGVELDLQRSKDGYIIIYHDKTLDKCKVTGAVSDYTLQELMALELHIEGKPFKKTGKLMLFEDFLQKYALNDAVFAIELKQHSIEKDVLYLSQQYGILNKAIFTSFSYDILDRLYSLNPNVKLGYLLRGDEQNVVEKLEKIKAYQVCLDVRKTTKQEVSFYISLGYRTRAWGVKNIELMRKVYSMGFDAGMTIDFEDKTAKDISRANINIGATMTNYERVERTLNCLETDRTPTFDSIRSDSVAEHFSGMKFESEPNTSHDKVLMYTAYENYIDAAKSFVRLPNKEGVFNINGQMTRYNRWTSWPADKAEYDYDTVAQKARQELATLKQNLVNIKTIAQQSWDDYQELSAQFKHTVFFHCAPATGAGPYYFYNQIHGIDNFIYLLDDDEALVEEILDTAFKCSLAFVKELPSDYSPIAAMAGEDIAFKSGTIFSHEFLRKYEFPQLKKIVELFSERGVPSVFHSDGDLNLVLDDLVDCGFTAIHPIESLGGIMDVGTIRNKYPKLVMCGAVDCSQLLPYGTPEEVYEVACENIRKAKNYGYFVGSTSEINEKTPWENIVAIQRAITAMK